MPDKCALIFPLAFSKKILKEFPKNMRKEFRNDCPKEEMEEISQEIPEQFSKDHDSAIINGIMLQKPSIECMEKLPK